MGRHLRDLAEQALASVPTMRQREDRGARAEKVRVAPFNGGLDALTGRVLDSMVEYNPRPGSDERAPSSREINEAIEVLARAGIPELSLMALDIWNATRIRRKVMKQPTLGDIQRLVAGLDRRRLSEAGVL